VEGQIYPRRFPKKASFIRNSFIVQHKVNVPDDFKQYKLHSISLAAAAGSYGMGWYAANSSFGPIVTRDSSLNSPRLVNTPVSSRHYGPTSVGSWVGPNGGQTQTDLNQTEEITSTAKKRSSAQHRRNKKNPTKSMSVPASGAGGQQNRKETATTDDTAVPHIPSPNTRTSYGSKFF
jgi:hypothetical protein